MPAIQCPGCKAHLSVKGLTECPLCGSPVPAPHLQAATTISATSPGQSAAAAKSVTGAVAIFAILAMAAALAYSAIFPSPGKLRDQAISKALATCQYAIKSTAQYGGAEMPPYVPSNSRAQDDEFYFAWPAGSFEFTNGFGARLKMSASCTGTLSTGKITALTVNGKDVI